MRKTLLAGVLVAGLLGWQTGAFAASQAGQEGQAGQTGTTQQGSKAGKAAKKAGKAASAEPDKAFITEAASGGMMEVELGRLAANQAGNEDVKKFGQRMVDDHSKANNELSALAQKKDVTLPTSMGKKEQAEHDRLAKLNGAAFDKAYMHLMVTDHTKDVRAFEHESKMGKDPDVKAWAGQTLPTLQDHLKQAKQVQSEVAGTKGETKKAGKEEGKK